MRNDVQKRDFEKFCPVKLSFVGMQFGFFLPGSADQIANKVTKYAYTWKLVGHAQSGACSL